MINWYVNWIFFSRQKIIEEERIKLLKEHAAQLIGFFPPGILRESDYAVLKIQ